MAKKTFTMLLCVLLVFCVCSCSGNTINSQVQDETAEPTNAAESNIPAQPSPEITLIAMASIEKTGQIGKASFTIHGMGTFGESNEFTAIDMSVKNDTNDVIVISHVYSLVAKDADGNQVEASMDGIIALGLLYSKAGQKATLIDSEIQPGTSHRGMVVYAKTDADRITKFELTVILEKSLNKAVLTINLK